MGEFATGLGGYSHNVPWPMSMLRWSIVVTTFGLGITSRGNLIYFDWLIIAVAFLMSPLLPLIAIVVVVAEGKLGGT